MSLKTVFCAGFLSFAFIVGGAILPAYVAPTLVIACGEKMLDSKPCEKIGERMFLSYFGGLDSLAHAGRYGFSIAGDHLEPAESLALLKLEPRR